MYQIISIHPDFIIVDKAPNVHFHSQHGEAGLVATVEQDRNEKLFAVHRLDTLTSGLIVLARSSKAAAEFTHMFTKHEVQKYYLAIAKGKPNKKQGWIIGDMAKSRRSMYKLLRTKENPAITQFFSYSIAPSYRLYLLKPHSGKTHQLRVALASLSVPILGDTLYGDNPQSDVDRGYLHAYGLNFTWQDQPFDFTCSPKHGKWFLSNEVTSQLSKLAHPEQLNWRVK